MGDWAEWGSLCPAARELAFSPTALQSSIVSQRLIPHLVVGSYGRTISLPAAETAARLDMVLWETAAVGELSMAAAPGEHIFRFAPGGNTLGRDAVAFVPDQLTPRLKDRARRSLRYTVTYVNDVYGRSVGLAAIAEIKASGLQLAALLPYQLSSVDYDDLSRRIAQARTDVLVVASYLDDAVAPRRALVRRNGRFVAGIGTSSSYCHLAFGRQLGPATVGLFASDKPDGDVIRTDRLSPGAVRALQWATAQYKSRYGEGLSAAALSGFAGGLALFQYVLPAAGSLSAEEVAQAAQAILVPRGALPNDAGLGFGPPGGLEAGMNLRAAHVIWEWVGPGVRAVVWPAAFATHPIVFPTRLSR